MKENSIHNLYETLTSAECDPVVGIKLARLTGNALFSLIAAEIAPNRKVGAHFHRSGIEIYQIVTGEGLMYLGKPGRDGRADWIPPFKLRKGDCFTVEEGTVHQLYNTSDEKMIAIFGCPESHLSTDRVAVENRSAGGDEGNA